MEFNIGKVRSNVQHLVSLIVSNDLRLYLEKFLNKKVTRIFCFKHLVKK